MNRSRVLVSLALVVSACGGSGDPAAPSFSGTYATVVTLGQNTCTNVTVQDMPTVVQHASGSTTFTMTHSGQTYNGTLASDNSYTTTPVQVTLNGFTYTIQNSGSFPTANTLSADLRLDRVPASGGAGCFYFVHWAGTRQ